MGQGRSQFSAHWGRSGNYGELPLTTQQIHSTLTNGDTFLLFRLDRYKEKR
jgi:hypothetical protein